MYLMQRANQEKWMLHLEVECVTVPCPSLLQTGSGKAALLGNDSIQKARALSEGRQYLFYWLMGFSLLKLD
uniref:Uncharacterized protein n=1 Tax=Triticum urartu TaxID=4572 RepID=A0A8R7TCI2_TRIUA